MAAEGIFQVADECRLPKPLQPLNPKYQIPKKPPPHWESAQICKWTYSTNSLLKPKFTSTQGQPLSLSKILQIIINKDALGCLYDLKGEIKTRVHNSEDIVLSGESNDSSDTCSSEGQFGVDEIWRLVTISLPLPGPTHLPSINNSTDHKLTRLLPKLTQTSLQSYAMKTKPFEMFGENMLGPQFIPRVGIVGTIGRGGSG